MKSLKRRLNEEFNAVAPQLDKDILSAPILAGQPDVTPVSAGYSAVKRRTGIIIACVAAAIGLLFALLAVFGVFSKKQPSFDRFVFTLEINPSVCFVTDENGAVQGVNALNEDADVVLSDQTTYAKLKNSTLSEAVFIFADSAARLGYLDLVSTEAVRITSSEETPKDLISGASDALRGYFMRGGIYAIVVEDIVPARELSARIGAFEAATLPEIVKGLNNLSEKFGERAADGADNGTLKSLYESYIVSKQMLALVRGELLDNIEKIVLNAEMLININSLNAKIMSHDDNPSALMKDFWSVKQFSSGEYTAEFAALMEETERELSEYERIFGERISSVFDLMTAAKRYSSWAGMDLAETFAALTAESFMPSAVNLVGILENIGLDVAKLKTLLNAPQTVEEYKAQAHIAADLLYNYRVERFSEIYSTPRGEISEDAYSEFIKKIESEYGSLENFWNKK